MTATPTPLPAPRFRLAGWSDVTTCDCCGRTDLRRTMRLIDVEGVSFTYGTGCAAKALRRPSSTEAQMRRAADKAQEDRAYFYAVHWATRYIDAMTGHAEEKLARMAAHRAGVREAELAAWLAAGADRFQARSVYGVIPGMRGAA